MFDIIICTLGTFGLAALIANYDGPHDILSKLRVKVVLTRCAVCLAVWIAIPLAILAGIGVFGYLAVIGGVIVLERLT